MKPQNVPRSDNQGILGAPNALKKTCVSLLGLGAYVPEKVVTNKQWLNSVDMANDWIYPVTGIKRRRIAAENESSADLATSASRSALEQAGLGPKELDEIIVATDTPDVYVPDTASFVQHRLGTREIPAYDLQGSGCAGFLMALDIAQSRAFSGSGRILVVGVEVLSQLIDMRDRRTAFLFGDAAAAAIIGAEVGIAEILATVMGTNGSRSDILGIEGRRKGQPSEKDDEHENFMPRVIMKGRAVFREAVTRMSHASEEVLSRAGFTIQDVALVVPHQANLRIIEAMARRMALPLSKFAINIHEYGNTGSASLPLALWEAYEEKRIHPEDLVLLTSFGAGLHWGAMLLRVVEREQSSPVRR